MVIDFNKVFLSGTLTRDPQLNTYVNDTKICRFTIASTRAYRDKEGKRGVDFINCLAFKKIAENITKYLKKGSRVSFIGKIQVSKFTDKNGNFSMHTDIVVDEIQFLYSKKSKNSETDEEEFVDELQDLQTDLPI